MTSTKFTIATAGNTLAPALAILMAKGFVVEPSVTNGGLLQATNGVVTLLGEDPLVLLGLAAIAEARGADWKPTDNEVAVWLNLGAEDV
jgi:hypothetical protein